MTKIMVEINNPSFCDCRGCKYFSSVREGYSYKKYCRIFRHYKGRGSTKRLPECIAAEIPEGYSTATFKALTRFYEETKGLKPLTNDPAEVKEEYDVVF